MVLINFNNDDNAAPGGKTTETFDIDICHMLVDHMFNGVAYCKMLYQDGQPRDFVYLYTNPAFEKLTGLKQVVGKPVSEVIPGISETDPQLFDIYGRVAMGAEPERFETFVEALGMWFSITVYSPKPEHFVAIFDVITERKQNELALSIANKRWSLAQRAAVAGAWYWDVGTNAIYWSDELYELFGLEPQKKEAGFDTWRRLLHSEDREQAEQRINQAISNHLPLTSEYRIITPTGKLRWIRALGDTHYDEQGLARSMTGICVDITKTKMAGIALQESEERLRVAQSAAGIGIWDWDIAHNKTSFNSKYYELLGLPEGVSHSYQDFLAMVHPEDRSRLDAMVQQALAEGTEDYIIEYRIIRGDDTAIRWMASKGRLIIEKGRPLRSLGVINDITERKQAEEALLKSQIDLNRAQAVAHVGSWRMNVCDNILIWSDETYRIFGIPKGSPLTYQLFLDSVHPADRHLVDAAWQNALTGKPYDIEHRIIVNQNIKWVRELAELEFDKHGLLLGAFGTTEDITDIKCSKEALQHEQFFLRQVIDATPSMIFVKDREGRFLLGNEALAQCYGTNSESLIGLTDKNFNPNDDEVAYFYQHDIDVINTGKAKLIPEEKVTHADGSVHWYNTIKIPLFDGDNSCNKLLGVATDITERKHAEEALLSADRRKDQFLAMLAHELRNPLAPIRNAVQLLKKQEAPDTEFVWSLEVIDRQVTHMAQLLDDLLDVARIMQGKIKLKVERFELTDIVNNAIETCHPLIESRGQELIILKTTTPQWIEGDRVRLAQALSNLLNNAAKYTPEGGKITLSIMRESPNAVIEVRDTGIGISSDILPQIFELFIQADHSLAHSQGGLGIGLTLVRQLIEIHGGSITAASAGIGQGSTFTLRLPAMSMKSSITEFAPVKVALT